MCSYYAKRNTDEQGQITIPKRVRDLMKLKTGDRIDFIAGPDGGIVMRPATIDVTDLKGILKRGKKKTVSIEEMNQAIKRRWKKIS